MLVKDTNSTQRTVDQLSALGEKREYTILLAGVVIYFLDVFAQSPSHKHIHEDKVSQRKFMISGKGFKSGSCQKFADANVSILKLVDTQKKVRASILKAYTLVPCKTRAR